MNTIETLLKCCLTFVVMLIGAYAAMFAFDSLSWLTNLSILAVIILFIGVILYLIWRKN
jgi:uncharacterized membrane protein